MSPRMVAATGRGWRDLSRLFGLHNMLGRMVKRRKPAPEPVGVDELKDAILRMIVEKFGDRPLTWEDPSMALSLAAFEIKQAAMFIPRKE